MIKRRLVSFFIASVILTLGSLGYGDTLTIPLTSSNYVNRTLTNGVWNLGLGELHPPLQIINIADLTPTAGPNRNMDIGDGSDGVFDATTYTNFGTVVGNVITINTDVKSEFKFTSFNLGNNMVIRPSGSKPLIIRSQADVIIGINAGIDCSGGVGQATNPFNEVGTPQISLGGVGRCGGGNGGNGGKTGSPATSGNNGVNGDPSGAPVITGGTGGLAGIDARGGGGGGAGGGFEPSDVAYQSTTNDAGTAAGGPPTNGTTGLRVTNDSFVNYVSFGGSGGAGGGGYFSTGSNLNGSGAGGGAGGGVIIILAGRDITLTDTYSFVVAHGGNGGDGGDGSLVSGAGATAGLAGAGGGGAGGTIWIVAARNYTDLVPGVGAFSGVFTRAGIGGSLGIANRRGAIGSHGRTWITDNDCVSGIRTGNVGLKCSVSEDNATSLSNYGQSSYKIGSYDFYSAAIDLKNFKPKVNSVSVTTVGVGTFTNKIQASDDPNFANPTAEVDISQASTVSGHRFLRLHLNINNTSATNPAMITALSVDYTPVPTTNFDFKMACGHIGTTFFDGLFFLLLFVGLYFAFTTKFRVPGQPGLPNYPAVGN